MEYVRFMMPNPSFDLEKLRYADELLRSVQTRLLTGPQRKDLATAYLADARTFLARALALLEENKDAS